MDKETYGIDSLLDDSASWIVKWGLPLMSVYFLVLYFIANGIHYENTDMIKFVYEGEADFRVTVPESAESVVIGCLYPIFDDPEAGVRSGADATLTAISDIPSDKGASLVFTARGQLQENREYYIPVVTRTSMLQKVSRNMWILSR